MHRQRNYYAVAGILFFFLTLLHTIGVSAQTKQGAEKGIYFTQGRWQDISAMAKKTGKYIFVDAYTIWCGPCKRMKSETFLEEKVAAYFNDNFINYAIDMEQGEGIRLAIDWEVFAYPSLLFFSPEGTLITRRIGFLRAKEFLELGESVEGIEQNLIPK